MLQFLKSKFNDVLCFARWIITDCVESFFLNSKWDAIDVGCFIKTFLLEKIHSQGKKCWKLILPLNYYYLFIIV